MLFELDNILTDEILFSMENQEGSYFLDIQKIQIVDSPCAEEDPDRFVPLPVWEPKDGYRLMEKFTANLKNPIVRQELSDALNKSKGVFRAFRDVLDQYPESKKIWLKYKNEKMKNEVVSWYNALREEQGLKPIGTEPEDTTSLILEDFNIIETSDFSFSAQSENGNNAANINAVIKDGVLHIEELKVNLKYRSLGLGKTLLSKLLEKADKNNLDVSIDVPAESDFFSRSLLLENFKPDTQRFIRKK